MRNIGRVSSAFLMVSYIVSWALFGRIIDKSRSKKEIVYYLSKIATVKNIVKINHQSKIFNKFNEEGDLEGINIYYQKLLQLIANDTCIAGYKKCGILDTIGNILCIDEKFDCPINQINVDLKSERHKYLNKGFKEIYNENLLYNYQFYYSMNSIDNNIIVSILFSQSQPNYITISNFAIDTEAYEDIIGALPAVNEDNNKKNDIDKAIQDVIIGVASNSEPITGNIIRVVFSLLSFASDKYMPNENMDDFRKYAQEKIKLEENKPDKYFVNIGENAYIKNYIGFQSIEDIETFMNFDYKKIYKKIFPSNNVYIVSIVFLTFCLLFFIIDLCFFKYFEEEMENIYTHVKSKTKRENEQKEKKDKESQENTPKINNNQIETGEKNMNKEENSLNPYSNVITYNTEENTNINNIKDSENIEEKSETKKSKKRCKYFKFRIIFQIIMSIIFILFNLWILLCAIKRYQNLNKNFTNLRKVKSDDFIQSFIKEFIRICSHKNSLYYIAYILSSIAMFFHLVGFVSLFISLFI